MAFDGRSKICSSVCFPFLSPVSRIYLTESPVIMFLGIPRGGRPIFRNYVLDLRQYNRTARNLDSAFRAATQRAENAHRELETQILNLEGEKDFPRRLDCEDSLLYTHYLGGCLPRR